VIVSATEDSWEHTIAPRLLAAGADMSRVFKVDVLSSDDVVSAPSLPRDLPDLAAVIREADAALVLFDPLLSRLDRRLDTHRDAEVRQALEPLAAIADQTGAVLLGLIHVNKSGSTDALTTLMASRAFAAVARSVLYVVADPDEDGVRLLGVPKNNLGRADGPPLRFRVDSVTVAETPQGSVTTGRLSWLGESTRSIKDAMAAVSSYSAADHTATADAADWLRYFLSRDGGQVDAALVRREAEKAGHSKDAMYRARKRLGVVCRSHGFPRRSDWSLPSSPKAAGESATNTNTATTENNEGQSSQSSQSSQSLPTHTRAAAPAFDPSRAFLTAEELAGG
jgi:hypothetical protein